MIKSIQQLKTKIETIIFLIVLSLVFVTPLLYVSNDSVLCSEVACGHYLPKVLAVRIGATIIVVLMLVRGALSWQCDYLNLWKNFNIVTIVRTYPIYLVVACLAIGAGISAVLSVSMDISLWGRVPMSDGTSFYNFISLIVIGLATLVFANSHQRSSQVIITAVLSGMLVSLLGIAMFYFGDGDGRSIPRLSASLPNPLQAGSYLIFTIGLSLIFIHRIVRHLESLAFYIASHAILIIQLLAVGLTQSRGPIAITVAMMCIFSGAYWYFLPKKTALKLMIPIIGSILIIICILGLSSGDISGNNDVLSGASESVVTTLQGRFSSSTDIASSGGFESRFKIWTDSLDLLLEPSKYQVLRDSIPVARLVFGFGPDSFAVMNGIGSTPNSYNGQVEKYLYAHNIFIQWVIELGMAGALLNVLVFIITGIIVYKFVASKHTKTSDQKMAGMLLFGILIFHLLDQMVNVTSVTDSLYRWVLLGLILQAVSKYSGKESFLRDTTSSLLMNKIVSIVVVAGLLLLAFFVVTVLWFKTINYTVGAIYASNAQELFASEKYAEAHDIMTSAIRIAPQNYAYHNWNSEILEGSLGETSFDLECSLQSSDYNPCIIQKVLDNDRAAAEIRPLELTPNIEAANSALKTISMGIDNRDEFIRYANRAQLIAPQDWGLKNWIAMAYMNLGMFQESDYVLSKSNDITANSLSSAQGFLLRGLLRQEIGRPGEAIDYYSLVIDLAADEDMTAQAYNNRGMIYRVNSQYEKALYDFNESLLLVGDSAEVHNNLGGLYLDNNRMSDALSSFSRAIFVNDNYAPAYFNRSLVFASMGNEDKAFADAFKAGDLGMEVDLLLEELENMIDAYNELNSD